jgi:zinc protease
MSTSSLVSVRPERSRASTGVLFLLALVLSACATLPERGQVVMRDVSFPLRDFRLGSGLRVVVEEDHRSPVVAVVAVVGTGSSSDPAGKEGMAHVVEHLVFRARHGGGASVWTRLEQMGAGQFNAFTSLDHTAYQTLVPREALPELLRLEAQRLAAPLAGVTEQVFSVEREVVRNELRERNETGFVGQIFQWVQEASFPAGHPYARSVIGGHDSLSGITLGDAQRFVRKNYQPDNVTLVITGDVDLVAMEALLNESLPESWRGSGPPLAVSPRLTEPTPEPPLAASTRPARCRSSCAPASPSSSAARCCTMATSRGSAPCSFLARAPRCCWCGWC